MTLVASGQRGYHPLLAIAAGTGDVLMARLREGRANTARGAAHFLRETVGRVRYAGARGQLTVRADSGFYTHAVVSACRRMDVRFSITIRQSASLRNLIEAIPEQDWTPIPYWMDGAADVAETSYTPFQGKPIVIEKLDFRQKKAALEGESRRYSRMLSSFSYGKIKAYFISRGYRQGVEVHQVNPAFSSIVGRVKFMERYGLTVHQAAALVLARRLLGCSERIPRRWVCPVGNGVQVAFTVPVRKRVKHVWTYWGAVSGQLRPALAAQHRLGRPNPVRAVRRVEARGMA